MVLGTIGTSFRMIYSVSKHAHSFTPNKNTNKRKKTLVWFWLDGQLVRLGTSSRTFRTQLNADDDDGVLFGCWLLLISADVLTCTQHLCYIFRCDASYIPECVCASFDRVYEKFSALEREKLCLWLCVRPLRTTFRCDLMV